ncbi:hypothetical protein WJX77_000664 [Trebouxia sp. C0004]
MGLASQLQQFQQQQSPLAQQGGGPSQGVQGGYAQAGRSQVPQQPVNQQYQQQQFPGGPQYPQGQQQQQQQQHGASQQFQQAHSSFPTIQQGWQQGQQGQQVGFLGHSGQQGGYQQHAPAPSQDFQGYVTSKLQQMVATNRLQAFYPPQRLQQVVNKVLHVDLRAVGQKYNMPMELAFDLCTLALYDVAIYADDSTSMKYAEGGERIKDLKAILSRVSEVASLFDDDGLTVRFMNSNLNGNNIKSSAEASSLIDQIKFEGMTPLGTNLDAKIIRPLFTVPLQKGALPKPILVICITDGEPTGEPENKVVSVIKEAKKMATNSPYGPGSIAFEFAQVGKDQAAQAFLARLDKHPDIGKMIDATSYYELEQEEYKRKGVTLTPDVWLVKLMVGAIDASFDEQD